MPIISNNYLYEAVSETVTKPVVAHRANLEWLPDCTGNCRGCFVDRDTPPYTDEDLDMLDNLMREVNETGALFDELVFGPVDFFGSPYAIPLLMEPKLQHILMTYKPIIAFPTRMCFEPEHYQKFVDVFNEYYPHEYLEFELQIVPDYNKIMADDREYIDSLKEKIEVFDGMAARVCYSLAINVQTLRDLSLHEISLKVKDEFETIVDVVPSFFRQTSGRTSRKMLEMWNAELEKHVTAENKNDIQLIIADWTHGGWNYVNWVFAQQKIYLSPFVHEKVADTSPGFLVPKVGDEYTVEDLNAAMIKARQMEFDYAPKTDECESCKYLDVCIPRHVLFYMQQYNFTHCLLPKNVLNLFSRNMGDMSQDLYDWSDYTAEGEVEHGNKKHHEFAERKGLI